MTKPTATISSQGDDPVLQESKTSEIPLVLPLVAHLVIGALLIPDVAGSYEGDGFDANTIPTMTPETWSYIGVLSLQIVVAIGILVYYRKPLLRQFPFRVSGLSIVVGIIGVVLWIAACYPQLEGRLLSIFGDFSRPSFNPGVIGDDGIRTLFLFVRFSVLCLIVPVVEELFVRGWLIRWVESPNWKHVTLTSLSTKALLAASVYGVVAHPMEAVAAFLWFGLVTLLMRRTGNLWDCIVAHSVTNLLLGIYVLSVGAWHLW
jgi:CAAX prenyl protease-like protein